MVTKNKIEKLVRPWLENDHIQLCEIKISGKSGSQLIQLFVDLKEANISIDECARISRQLQDLIDMQDWAPSNYRLVVSSPGLDWPLGELWQFRKNIGHLVRHSNHERTLEVRLLEVTDEGKIIVETEKQRTEYMIEDLRGAKVVAELNRENRVR